MTQFRDQGYFDELPPWDLAEDEAPQAGGPVIISATYEYLTDSCPIAKLTVVGTVGESPLSLDSLALFIAPGELKQPQGEVQLELDGDKFTVHADYCATWQYNGPTTAAWAHLSDSDGRGSNARCVFVKAEPGIPVDVVSDGP